MLNRLLRYLLDLEPRRLVVLGVVVSELMSLAIVACMSILLRGRVERDFLLTGLVTAGITSVLVLALIVRLLEQRRHMEERLILAERLASLGRLAAGMGHEINNPLTFVLGNLELLHARLAAQLDAEAEELVADAITGAERVRDIVRDLRVMSRPDESRVEPVDLRKVIDFCLTVTRAESKHRATVTCDLGPVRPVLGNEARLSQVVLNLVVNALQAMPERPAAENVITLSTRMDGDTVVLEVRDNGPGMTQVVAQHAFEPFYSTKLVGEGTGLGLSICHGIVTALGGSIELDTHPGQGATFIVRLPSANAQVEARPSPEPPRSSGRRRILVVDDEPQVARYLQLLLAPHHDITVVTRPQEVLELLAAGRHFDLMLCDVLMPDMNGIDLHERVSALSPRLGRNTVFMSGALFNAPRPLRLDQLPNRRLDKPFKNAEILSVIDEVLE